MGSKKIGIFGLSSLVIDQLRDGVFRRQSRQEMSSQTIDILGVEQLEDGEVEKWSSWKMEQLEDGVFGRWNSQNIGILAVKQLGDRIISRWII